MMANLHIILHKDDDEGVINFLSEKYNVVRHDTSFQKAIESIQNRQISSEIIWVSEYAERGEKELIEAIKELRENINEATRIIVVLGEERKNETEFIKQLDYLDIDYYAVDRYSASDLKTWIETAKSKLPALVWVAEENKEIEAVIINSMNEFVFKKFSVANIFKEQSTLLSELNNTYPDVIALGYIQGKHGTEELIDEIKKGTENKVQIVVILNEEDKVYEKSLKKKGVDVHYVKVTEQESSSEANEVSINIESQKKLTQSKDDEKINIIEKVSAIAKDIARDLEENNTLKNVSKVVENNTNQSSSSRITESRNKDYFDGKIVGSIVIALGGADRGVGTTHAAYALSNFIARHGYKTAYVEKSEHPVMDQFFSEENHEEIDGGYKVSKNLDVYVKYANGMVKEDVYQKGYNFVILDLGKISTKENGREIKLQNFIEMQRSYIPIVIGTGSKWGLTRAAEAALLGNENWKVYINFANPRDEKKIVKAFKEICDKEAYLAPFSPDPFLISKEQDIQFAKLIEVCLGIKINEENQKSILSKLKLFQK